MVCTEALGKKRSNKFVAFLSTLFSFIAVFVHVIGIDAVADSFLFIIIIYRNLSTKIVQHTAHNNYFVAFSWLESEFF